MTATLDDTYDRLTELEQALARFEDEVAVSWAETERAFEPLGAVWSDAARQMLDDEHEALRVSVRALIQVEGPARLGFLRDRQALLQSYLQQRV